MSTNSPQAPELPERRNGGKGGMWELRPRRATFSALVLLASAAMAHAQYTLTVDPKDNRGIWEGWGTSLCWWGNGVGNSAYETTFADLIFTTKNVAILRKRVPGLGLNIARYNVGGGGKGDVIDGATEKLPANFPWFRDIDGFWINWFNLDPTSASWDWTRDANQRKMMLAARDRGATVEFFANGPMWWMTSEKSSAGGQLQWWNRRDFARYLATTIKVAIDKWKVNVYSVEPFNEPSAGWWNYPKDQEGCNISWAVQTEILGYLREELNARGLSAVKITASDENAMSQAKANYDYQKTQTVKVNGVRTNATRLIGKVNVHSYNGLDAWRDNATRMALRTSIGTTRAWCSEFGDPDGGGMALAQTITEDINYLRPSAWVYWQVVEPYSGWGLVNADYAEASKQNSPDRAKPTWIYTKYYTFAQFTRFLRPGYKIIGSNDHNTVVGYNAAQHRLVLITVNYGNAQKIAYDLRTLTKVGTTGTVTVTNTAGPKQLSASPLTLTGGQFTISAEANSVYSVVINDVTL